MAELLSAKSSEQVASAIEKLAAPVGEHLEARNPSEYDGRFYLMATGIVGGSYLYSGRLIDTKANGKKTELVGLGVPVGVEVGFNWCHGTLGAMFGVFDFGNIAQYTTENKTVAINDTTESAIKRTPEIGFSQVFSPGIYGSLGIGRNWPFKVLLGYRIITPQVIQVENVGNASVNGWMIMAGIERAIQVWR